MELKQIIMEVKIYREEENQSLILNEDQVLEYNELAARIGVIPIEKANENKIPGIYPALNYAMQKQLQALCPMVAEVENFNYCTIPLEVLKVLDFAKSNSMYEGYQVWFNDVAPDPMLIGWNWKSDSDRLSGYTWKKNRFLIARWGDCALELPELLLKGTYNIKRQLIDKAKIAQDKINAVQSNPDAYVNAILANSIDKAKIDLNTSADSQIY
jgi:hypothetical protein